MSSSAAALAGSPSPATALPPVDSAPPPVQESSPPPPVESPPPPVQESSPLDSAPPPVQESSPPDPPVDSAPPPVQESSPFDSASPPLQEYSPPPPVDSAPPPVQGSSPFDSASPPVQESSPPPPVDSAPPPVQESSPPPPVESPPPPVQESSPFDSAPPPVQESSSPPPTTKSLPPPPVSASSPPEQSLTTPTAPSPSSSSSDTIPSGTLAIIVIAGVVAVSVLLGLVLCFCKKKKKRKRHYYAGDHHGPPGGLPAHYKDSYYDPNLKQKGWYSPYSSQSTEPSLNTLPPPPPPPPFMMSDHDPASSEGNSGAAPGMGSSKHWFTYEDLAAATNRFSKANILGEGGFGCVFKGVLSNGQVVAVKQLKSGASQGEKEFQAEVEIISRVHHRHLVSLVGYCIADNQRLLVYDYVSNDTLEYHLHKRKGGPALDWPTRIKVASGAARGLAYLHEDCHPRIIHRDIKSANILLDNDFEAQVADFGLAKLTSDFNTHVSTRVMGTFGYLAPEYASSGKLTEKSDVFSFGVVLLELLTGRNPVDVSQPSGQESLVEWARPILAQVESEDDLEMLADPSLNGAYDIKEMMRMAEAAAACVRHSAHKRPRMGQVVRALEDEMSLADLNKGSKPGQSSLYGSSSSEYEPGSHSADIRKFRMALNETSETGVTPIPYSSSSEYQTSREIEQDTRRMWMSANTTLSSSNEFSSSK